MLKKKSINVSYLKKVKTNPEEFIKGYSIYRKNENIEKYDDNEIREMLIGIFKKEKHLMVDEQYFIPINNVIKVMCIVANTTLLKTNKEINEVDFKDNITLIKTFFVKDFFLITSKKINDSYRHKITDYLYKMGGYNRARGKNSSFYNIPNDTKLLYKNYPVDLYHPIKRYIGEIFYGDGQNVFDFEVVKVSI